MSCLGNILWFICGGLLSGLSWCAAGVLWCVTIVGIPIGNIFWLILSGIPMAIEFAAFGIVCGITIIGIPFAKQYFKLARLALTPFGAEII